MSFVIWGLMEERKGNLEAIAAWWPTGQCHPVQEFRGAAGSALDTDCHRHILWQNEEVQIGQFAFAFGSSPRSLRKGKTNGYP